MSLQLDIAREFGGWVELLARVVVNNPHGDIYELLSRKDVAAELRKGIDAGHTRAQQSLANAWSVQSPSPYRASLDSDIERAYSEAEAVLRETVARAFIGVPTETFVQGETAPGRHPAMEAARSRAELVRQVASSAAMYLGFRNEMTEVVARTRRSNELLLAGAKAGWYKKWVTRRDTRVCLWCAELARQDPIPVGQEFDHGAWIGRHQPPRVYQDLQCPPRHPRCRCRIALVHAGTVGTPEPTAPALFIPASLVRSMPAARYTAVRDFHRAALHELGQAVRRHYQAGTG